MNNSIEAAAVLP